MPTSATAARQELLRRLLEKYERERLLRALRPLAAGPDRPPRRPHLPGSVRPRRARGAGRPARRRRGAGRRGRRPPRPSSRVRRRRAPGGTDGRAGSPSSLRAGRGVRLPAARRRPARSGASCSKRCAPPPSPRGCAPTSAPSPAGSAAADLAPLGLQRERFKRERRDVLDALTAAAAIARGCRRVGARRERAHLRRLEAAGRGARAGRRHPAPGRSALGRRCRATTRPTCSRRTASGASRVCFAAPAGSR